MSIEKKKIERVQTGVRLEKRILKVLKAVAAEKEIGLGDLLEGIVLHAFEGKSAFGTETLAFVQSVSKAYKLDLDASDSHRMQEE